MTPLYQIRRAKNDEFYFVLIAPNNEIILTASETYKSKQWCEAWITSVRINSQVEARYKKMIAKDKTFYSFYLYASNWELLWRSQRYKEEEWRDNWIKSVKENWETLKIEDKSNKKESF